MIDNMYASVLAGLVGLSIGSFLNVVIFRLPRDQSVVAPRSYCPACGQALSIRDNIPLISFALALGRCRFCGRRISVRYPLIELLTALVFVAHFRIWGLDIDFFTRTIFFLFLLSMACIDGEHFIIPDELSLGGLVLGLALSFVPGNDISWKGALFAAFSGALFLFVVGEAVSRILKEDALGFGDVKMIAMIGSFVGWQGVIITIFLGSLVGSVIFLPLYFLGRRKIPFGVFLAIGGLIAVYFRDPLVHAYLSTFM